MAVRLHQITTPPFQPTKTPSLHLVSDQIRRVATTMLVAPPLAPWEPLPTPLLSLDSHLVSFSSPLFLLLSSGLY